MSDYDFDSDREIYYLLKERLSLPREINLDQLFSLDQDFETFTDQELELMAEIEKRSKACRYGCSSEKLSLDSGDLEAQGQESPD